MTSTPDARDSTAAHTSGVSSAAYDELVDACHRLALHAATTVPDAALTAALDHALRERDAVAAELERLQARTEVKVGELVRRIAHRVRPAVTDRSVGGGLDHHHDATSVAPGPAPASALIVVRNRRHALHQLLELLTASGVQRIEIVDDATSDPATLQELASLRHPVRRFESELGEDVVWTSGLMANHLAVGHTLLIGGDSLPTPSAPSDVVTRLVAELDRRSDADAVALPVEDVAATGGRRPVFQLVRAASPRRPRRVVELSAPYGVTLAPADPDDPAERFAVHHDRPRRGVGLR